MIKKYNEFINEQFDNTVGKLFIEGNQDEEVEWKLILNIVNLWDLYNKNSNVEEFNENLINYLKQNKDLIKQAVSDEAWSDLEDIIYEDFNSDKDMETIYDKIYDVCDEYSIELITENNKEK